MNGDWADQGAEHAAELMMWGLQGGDHRPEFRLDGTDCDDLTTAYHDLTDTTIECG